MRDERSSEQKYWLTRFGIGHPVRATVISALSMGAWTSIIVGDLRAVAGVVVRMMVLIGFVLRPGGIVRRLWVDRFNG